jgi:hypothetical protein
MNFYHYYSAIVSDYSSLSATELWPLVPRAVLAIAPERFNVSFVGQRLKTPTIIALPDRKTIGRQEIIHYDKYDVYMHACMYVHMYVYIF